MRSRKKKRVRIRTLVLLIGIVIAAGYVGICSGFECCFSGGSEYGSTRNNNPPAMPVSLSCFSFKQKTSYATMNVVPQPHYVTRR